MHSRSDAESCTIKSQLSASMKTNSSRPFWWDSMILKLHGNETRSSCDQRSFFSLGTSRLVDAASPRTISRDKKKVSSGTQLGTGLQRFVQHLDWLHCMLGKKSKNFFYVFQWTHKNGTRTSSDVTDQAWHQSAMAEWQQYCLLKECFHMTSRRPYWCLTQWNGNHVGVSNQSCGSWILFFMQTLSFVPINLHRCWPSEWKRPISPLLISESADRIRERCKWLSFLWLRKRLALRIWTLCYNEKSACTMYIVKVAY